MDPPRLRVVDQSKTRVNRQIEVLGSSSTGEVAVTEKLKCTQSNRCSKQEGIKQMVVVIMEVVQYNTAVKQCFQEMSVETVVNNYIGKI